MATIKAYTDIYQSKKLSEILPLESADMWYQHTGFNIKDGSEKPIYFPMVIRDCESDEDIPCWNLAALLSVIPKPDLIQNSEGTWLVRSWINAYHWSVGGYSNPVDACVDMIFKLKQNNLL